MNKTILFVSSFFMAISDTFKEIMRNMKTVSRILLFAALPLLAGCPPETAFRVSLRLEDETTGKPIADAWVVAIADVDYAPLREEPYNKAVAAARGITDPRGKLKLKKLEGIYFGQEPGDQLWLMLESRKPAVGRRITGIRAGSIFIFSKEYGFIHQPFTVTSTAADYAGLVDFGGYELTQKTVRLDPQAIAGGKGMAIKVKKLADADKIKSAFQTEFLAMLKSGMTAKTGATVKEKEALYSFFVRNMKEASQTSADPFYKHEYENLSLPEVKKEVINWELANAENHDTAIHEWLTQKALESLPGETEEVKQYASAVLAGVKAEDDGLRFYNHFYDPQNPGSGYNGNETALQWGAIGYPDNPGNDWDWEDAKRYYRSGDKEKAYTALGHVAHLLEDLTCPMHTHLIRHAAHWDNAARFEAYFSALIKQNAGGLPMEYSMAEGPASLKDLREHFNDTAKLTFGAFTQNGRIINFDDYYGPGKLIKQPDDETLGLMGGYLFPKTIAQTAGLMRRFYDAARPELSAQAKGATDAMPATGNQEEADSVPIEEYVPKVIIEGKWGTGPGEFGQQGDFDYDLKPGSLAVDSTGNIYILDFVNNRIQKYSEEGKHLKDIQIDGLKGPVECWAVKRYDEETKETIWSVGSSSVKPNNVPDSDLQAYIWPPEVQGVNIVIDSKDTLYYYLKRVTTGKETGEVWEFKNDKLVGKTTFSKKESLLAKFELHLVGYNQWELGIVEATAPTKGSHKYRVNIRKEKEDSVIEVEDNSGKRISKTTIKTSETYRKAKEKYGKANVWVYFDKILENGNFRVRTIEGLDDITGSEEREYTPEGKLARQIKSPPGYSHGIDIGKDGIKIVKWVVQKVK